MIGFSSLIFKIDPGKKLSYESDCHKLYAQKDEEYSQGKQGAATDWLIEK